MKKLLFNILSLIIVVMLVACSDFLDKKSSSYSTSGFYQSEAAIKSGTEGVYNYLYLEVAYAIPFNISFDHYTGMAMERNENTTIGAGGGLNPDNNEVKTLWNKLYVIIARSNSVIYGANDYIDGLGDLARQYLAEVKVIRAFAYYNLIATYGDVPFFTAPVTIDQYKVK